ncbi:PIN domain-containing protein [Nodosilinea sp. P-1105]|uniref:type II toxin-antitoxin system VapC family toxin n=1 Tax=Nodosilinea sp. P-1105 TaxID=2546229 RepID=UPI003242B065
MYLVNTNIWLERLLNQQQAAIVGEFLQAIPSENLAMSDFTFHSIALALTRRQLSTPLQEFIQDAFVEGNVGLLSLPPMEASSVLRTMREQNLDYDDAYQYATAEQYDLILVSFDTDFDNTYQGRKAPQEILSKE